MVGKRFKFSYKNVCDGHPDAQTRVDWVKQMGTPYPHQYVKNLFRESRKRANRRKAKAEQVALESGVAADPVQLQHRPPKLVRVLLPHVLQTDAESEDGGSEPGQREPPSSSESVASADTPHATHPPPRPLKQAKINAWFSAPPSDFSRQLSD